MASFKLNSPSRSGLEHLRDYHTFGRRENAVDTYINHTYVSKLHAIIEWKEPSWMLKDVSKNGVKLNGKIIPAQRNVALSLGDTIIFTSSEEIALTMVDLSPPKSLLVNVNQPSRTIELSESILLPDEINPELALHLCPDRQQWFTETLIRGDENGPYEHGDRLELNESEWRFLLICESDSTKEFSPQKSDLSDALFRFDISQDEECTELTLIDHGLEIDLGERSHHYLMVHLLRHRTKAKNGTGWLDNQLIMKELGLEESHLNIQVFRARKQVATALSSAAGHSKLIERRRGALRVGINNFEIYKEGVREA